MEEAIGNLKKKYNELVSKYFYKYDDNDDKSNNIGYYIYSSGGQQNTKRQRIEKKLLKLSDTFLKDYSDSGKINSEQAISSVNKIMKGINELIKNIGKLFITPDLLYFLKYVIEMYPDEKNDINIRGSIKFIEDMVKKDDILFKNNKDILENVPSIDSLYKEVEKHTIGEDGRGRVDKTERNIENDFYKLIKYSENGVYTYIENRNNTIKLKFSYDRLKTGVEKYNNYLKKMYKNSADDFYDKIKRSTNLYMQEFIMFDKDFETLFITIRKPNTKSDNSYIRNISPILKNVNGLLQKMVFGIEDTDLRTLCKITGHGPKYKFYLNRPKDDDDLNISTGINHPIVKYEKIENGINTQKYCGCGSENYLNDVEKKQCVKNACELEILKIIENKLYKFIKEKTIEYSDLKVLKLWDLKRSDYKDINYLVSSAPSNKYYNFIKHYYLKNVINNQESLYITKDSFKVNGNDVIRYSDKEMLKYILKKYNDIVDLIIDPNGPEIYYLYEAIIIVFVLEINNLRCNNIGYFFGNSCIVRSNVETVLFLNDRLFNIGGHSDFANFFKNLGVITGNTTDYQSTFSDYEKEIIKKYINIKI